MSRNLKDPENYHHTVRKSRAKKSHGTRNLMHIKSHVGSLNQFCSKSASVVQWPSGIVVTW